MCNILTAQNAKNFVLTFSAQHSNHCGQCSFSKCSTANITVCIGFSLLQSGINDQHFVQRFGHKLIQCCICYWKCNTNQVGQERWRIERENKVTDPRNQGDGDCQPE